MRGCRSLPFTVSKLILIPSAFSAAGSSSLRSSWSEAGTKSFQRSQCTVVPWAKAGARPVARMPAMPPTSAVPLLRTLRRVTLVMHSSLVILFGRSDAGLDSLSDYRASVVQRIRAFSRAQHVVSTVSWWCSQTSSVDGNFGVKQGGFFAKRALQPAHEPYRHIGTLPRSSGVAVAERVFPVLWRAWYRNAGATPLSPVAAGNQVLALSPVPCQLRYQFAGHMAPSM